MRGLQSEQETKHLFTIHILYFKKRGRYLVHALYAQLKFSNLLLILHLGLLQ